MDRMSNRIAMDSTLETFFRDLLQQALAAERLELDEAGLSYLVRLMGDFSRHEALYASARPDEPGTPTLVWLYEKAQTAERSQRFEAYRHLGDVALVVSGLFGAHLERQRSLVGVDYYVGMGRAAYDSAAHLARPSIFERVLGELAEKFNRVVEVLTHVAEQTTLPVRRDLEALYERIVRSPESPELQRRLADQGLVLTLSPTKASA